MMPPEQRDEESSDYDPSLFALLLTVIAALVVVAVLAFTRSWRWG